MHQARGPHDAASVGLADGLVPEAHAEDRQRPAERAEQLERDAGLVGGAWARGNEQPVGLLGADPRDVDPVVPVDLHLGAELAEVLHQVEGERVVVVDHQNARSRHASFGVERSRGRCKMT